MSSLWQLSNIFVHYDRGSYADIQTFRAAKLGDTNALDIRIIQGIKTHAKTFIAENKGALAW